MTAALPGMMAYNVGERRLWLRFDDGAEGEVDIARLVSFSGVFEPLLDPVFDVHFL
jgi:hypothetical protein